MSFSQYLRLSETNLPSIVQECIEVFRSEAMFLTLSNLTGLRLHPLAPEQDDSDEENIEIDTEQEVLESGDEGAAKPCFKKQRLSSECNASGK